MKYPTINQKIYIPSSYHISRGSDDVRGGLATISNVIIEDWIDNEYNQIMVELFEIPNVQYNYTYLMENQDKWKEMYGGDIAQPDPDVDTPWIGVGDIINGFEWTGKTIW